MADYKVTDTELTSIANAIRTKGSTQAQLEFPTGFVSAINAIPSGGGGGEYHRIRYYNNSGDVLLYTEYFLDGSHPTRSEDYAAEPNGTTPVDLSLVSISIDVYMIAPDDYHVSNDGTLGVLVYNDCNVWFFNGYTKTAGDTTIPSELIQYAPSGSVAVYQAKAYNSSNSDVWFSNIGFYGNTIRSWTTDDRATSAVDGAWAVVEVPKRADTPYVTISGATCQNVLYMSPAEYYELHPIESD